MMARIRNTLMVVFGMLIFTACPEVGDYWDKDRDNPRWKVEVMSEENIKLVGFSADDQRNPHIKANYEPNEVILTSLNYSNLSLTDENGEHFSSFYLENTKVEAEVRNKNTIKLRFKPMDEESCKNSMCFLGIFGDNTHFPLREVIVISRELEK